jgi:hypothetical protein
MRRFVLRGVKGVTTPWGVYIADGIDWDSDRGRRLIRHEMEHVSQFARYGAVRFMYLYSREYLRNRRAGMSHQEAYYNVSYEAQARSAARGDDS